MKIEFFDQISEKAGVGIILIIFGKPAKSFFRVAIGNRVDWVWSRMSSEGERIKYLIAFHIVETDYEDIGHTRGWELILGPLAVYYQSLAKR